MNKKNNALDTTSTPQVDENLLFTHVAEIIENRKFRATAYANSEVTLMYWDVGRYINSVILDFKRAKYSEKIFATLSRKLVETYGNSFEVSFTKIISPSKNMYYDSLCSPSKLLSSYTQPYLRPQSPNKRYIRSLSLPQIQSPMRTIIIPTNKITQTPKPRPMNIIKLMKLFQLHSSADDSLHKEYA